ncbi:hypothetical protein M514_01539, partial [Trichuris suis]
MASVYIALHPAKASERISEPILLGSLMPSHTTIKGIVSAVCACEIALSEGFPAIAINKESVTGWRNFASHSKEETKDEVTRVDCICVPENHTIPHSRYCCSLYLLVCEKNMFGQKTAFGSPSFGSAPAFGAQSSFLFGSKPTTGFGTPTTQSTGLFGSNPTTTSGGLFGSSTATPSGGLFGSSNAFGQTTSSLFGTTQSKPLFGTSATPAFGSGGTTGAFTFGSQQQGTSAGGMFGQPAQQTGSSLFRSTGTTGSSLFGSTQPPAGTTVKFEPVVGSDTMLRNSIQTNITTKHQCITSMKHYEGKSLEELRVEDYLANRKGPQQPSSLGFGVASQPQTRSLFGSTSTTATGTNVFGQTQDKPLFGSSPFGSTQPSTGLFGQPTTTQSTGLFGQKPLFGSTTTSASAFTFTSPTTTGGGLFGQSQPQQTGLFGSTTGTTAPFGQQTGFNFGQPQTQTGSPFGVAASTAATSTGSLFGGTGGGGLFGSKPGSTTTSSLFPSFGSSTTTFGGAQQPSLFNFSQTQQKPLFGGFGQNLGTQTGGLFNAPTTGTTGGGLFSNLNKPTFPLGGTTQPSSIFGGGTLGSTGIGTFGQSTINAGSALATDPSVQAAQEALVRSQLAALANSPYGQSPLLKLMDTKDASPTDPNKQREALEVSLMASSLLEKPKTLPPMRPSPRLLVDQLQLTGHEKSSKHYAGLLDELEGGRSLPAPSAGFVPKKNIKKLIIKQRQKVSQTVDQVNGNVVALTNGHSAPPATIERTFNGVIDSNMEEPSPIPRVHFPEEEPISHNIRHLRGGPTGRMTSTPKPSLLPPSEAPPPPLATSVILEESAVDTEKELENPQSRHGVPSLNQRRDQLGIVCKRDGYYCDPSLEELEEMIGDDGYCIVSNFTVGRENYGSVMWFGPLNVTGLNLDRLVHFDHKEVTVYPEGEVKPPIGEELNRRARIVLERVWPIDKSTFEPITDPIRILRLKFRNRLEKACARMEAKFVDYDSSRGIWTFEVDHFSKYGLVDDEYSEDEEEVAADGAAEVGDEINQRDDSVVVLQRSVVQDDQLPSVSASNEKLAAELSTRDLSAMRRKRVAEERLRSSLESKFIDKLPLDAASLAICPDLKKAMSKGDYESALRQIYNETVEMMDASTEVFEPPPTVERPLRPLVKKYTVKAVPREKSFTASMECRCASEATFLGGNRFKISWLPGRRFIKLVDPSAGSFTLSICQPTLVPDKEENLTAISLLKQLLHCSKAEMSASGLPFLLPTGRDDLVDRCLKVTTESKAKSTSIWASCFSLCQTLFCSIEGGDSSDSRVRESARASALRNWLQRQNADVVSKRIIGNPNKNDVILILLLNGQIEKAATIALESKNLRLALLIASTGGWASKRFCLEQMISWFSSKAVDFIDDKLLLIYVVLTGQLTWNVRKQMLLFKNLPWLLALSFYLWHSEEGSQNVRDALVFYDAAWRQENGIVPPPYSSFAGDIKVEPSLDVRYHLLKLYSSRTHPIQSLLCTLTWTNSPFNFHLSWFLWCVMSALGFSNFSENAVTSLHLAYAAQLEGIEQWRWAIFVLMHISNESIRLSAVRDVLSRHCFSIDSDAWALLVDEYGLPENLLFESIALRDRYVGDDRAEFKNLLRAGRFHAAQKILVEKIGPNLFLRGRLVELKELLESVRAGSALTCSCDVLASLVELALLKSKQNESLSEYDDDAFSMLASNRLGKLMRQLRYLPSSRPIQQLFCGRASAMLTSLLRMTSTSSEYVKMADDIMGLPLPDDFLLDEVKCISNMALTQFQSIAS